MVLAHQTALSHARMAYAAARYVVGRRAVARDAARQGANAMQALRFADHKRSDTLFVLGSGASINRLGPGAWREIAKHDSLGFNNWLVHEHTPTYFLFEQLDRHHPQYARVAGAYEHNFRVARERYARVPILAATSDARPLDASRIEPSLRPNLHLLSTLTLQGQTVEHLIEQVRFFDRLGWFSPQPNYQVSITKRASLFRALHFGLIAGYRHVVLCGVDLNNTTYFFQEDEEAYARRGYRLDHVASLQQGPVHKTIDPAFGALTIDALITSMREQVLGPRGVDVRVASASSALYPRVPLHRFEHED